MAVKKVPNPIDVHVGKCVRMRRLTMGMSQEKLGEQLGITFQQVQKYEKGTNRIGASRLQQIATVLQMPVSFFFDGLTGAPSSKMSPFAEPNPSIDFFSTGEGLRLCKAFSAISDPLVRRRMVDLVEAIAKTQKQH